MLLKGINQEHEGQTFTVTNQLLAGRYRKSDIHIEDALVSRSHVKFYVDENLNLYLCDLNSRNGTFVNGSRVEGEVEIMLNHNDLVRVGHSEFRVIDQDLEGDRDMGLVDDSYPAFLQPALKKDLTINQHHITDSFLIQQRRGGGLGGELGGELETSSEDHTGSSNRAVEGPQWFEVLLLVNREIQTQSDPKKMSAQIANLILKVLDGDRCLIALLNQHEELELHTVVGRTTELSGDSQMVRISKTVIQEVINGRCALHVNDIARDKRFNGSDSLICSKVHSLIVAPLIIGNQVIGLIEVSRLDGVNTFSEAGLDLITIVGSMLGVALKHAEQLKQREDHIAELKEAQRRLEEAQQDLVRSQKLAVLGRMASSINHEIGNLLMPLLEHHTAILEDEEGEDSFELFTPEELAYSCTQIKSLIEDIKHFSRGDDHQPQMSRCDLFEQVQKATRFVQIDRKLFPASGPHKISILLECDENRPRVIMDPLQIGRVIINLLRNAAQAMRGQPVPPVIVVRVGVEDGDAVVEVEDNGPGIPEEVRHQLFEPFISTKGEDGLGLGLDISRKIVHKHRGSISFSLGEERGTTFKIKLQFNPTLNMNIGSLVSSVSSIPSLPTISEEM